MRIVDEQKVPDRVKILSPIKRDAPPVPSVAATMKQFAELVSARADPPKIDLAPLVEAVASLRQEPVPPVTAPITRWEFRVIRDPDGLIERIIAEPTRLER